MVIITTTTIIIIIIIIIWCSLNEKITQKKNAWSMQKIMMRKIWYLTLNKVTVTLLFLLLQLTLSVYWPFPIPPENIRKLLVF